MKKATIGYLVMALVVVGLAFGLFLEWQQNAKLIERLSRVERELPEHSSNAVEQSAPSASTNTEAGALSEMAKKEAASASESGSQHSSTESNGKATGRDEEVKSLRLKAEQGDVEAQYELGILYVAGVTVAQNYEESQRWLLKAGTAGYGPAQYALGLRFEELGGWQLNALGRLERNERFLTTAWQWHRAAAEQGLADAQVKLGEMYALGWGVRENNIEALKWYTLAAAQGHSEGIKQRDSRTGFWAAKDIKEAQRRAAAFVARPRFDYSTSRFATLKGSGTGFFVTEDGYLLTNGHVVEGAGRIEVKNDKRTFSARVIKSDTTHDLALLKVEGVFQPLSIADSREIKLGEAVFTLGFPNTEVQGFEPKLTRGDVNGLFGKADDRRFFQISVPVQPGNSGGPLLNESGVVVGIVTLRLNDLAMLARSGMVAQNVNYAVKSAVILDFLAAVPDLSSKLKPIDSAKVTKFDDAVRLAQAATVRVLSYGTLNTSGSTRTP